MNENSNNLYNDDSNSNTIIDESYLMKTNEKDEYGLDESNSN